MSISNIAISHSDEYSDFLFVHSTHSHGTALNDVVDVVETFLDTQAAGRKKKFWLVNRAPLAAALHTAEKGSSPRGRGRPS